ncbi:MAG: aldo/keto reductase [Elusimicrobia bacterium]|nr:aldo/keto reductase [Elusimicrobiota bacterium]
MAALGFAQIADRAHFLTASTAKKEAPGDFPKRALGTTGFHATILGLGGEGVLRTTGRHKEAGDVIRKALDLGINYFDTAPAYEQSRDYLGLVFKEMGARREKIFIASKTHARDKRGTLDLIEDTLKRLNVDHLDLLQLHDLREARELDQIFGKNGALEAMETAKRHGKIRFTGITGHHDPEILIDAMKKYEFDAILTCVNPGDPYYLPFITTVLPEARKRHMGIIAMKIFAKGYLLKPRGNHNVQEAISYALSQDVDLAIVGCNSPDQVEENVRIANAFRRLSRQELLKIESLAKNNRYAWWFKKS